MNKEKILTELLVKIDSETELCAEFSSLELLTVKMVALGLLHDSSLNLDKLESWNEEWAAGGGELEQVEAARVAYGYLRSIFDSDEE